MSVICDGADTDGLLDRCAACGARAKFSTDVVIGAAVDCTECANGTGRCDDQTEAMIAWNKQQRFAKGDR